MAGHIHSTVAFTPLPLSAAIVTRKEIEKRARKKKEMLLRRKLCMLVLCTRRHRIDRALDADAGAVEPFERFFSSAFPRLSQVRSRNLIHQ